jgi:hypothetical protein
VAPGETAPLSDPIAVEATSTGGVGVKFVVGMAGTESRVEFEGRSAVLKDQALHARLAAILAKD